MSLRVGLRVVALALATLAPSPALASAEVSHTSFFFQGAHVDFADCPATPPSVPTECTGITLFWVRDDNAQGTFFDGVGGGRGKAPFFAAVEGVRLTINPDGTVDEGEFFRGFTVDATGTWDKTTLASASVIASIPLSDGTVFDVDLQWTATDPIIKHGNDGPLSEDAFGIARHIQDRCTTANYNDHQRVRFASVEGNLDGRAPSEFAFLSAAIIDHWFHWNVTTHGSCTAG